MKYRQGREPRERGVHRGVWLVNRGNSRSKLAWRLPQWLSHREEAVNRKTCACARALREVRGTYRLENLDQLSDLRISGEERLVRDDFSEDASRRPDVDCANAPGTARSQVWGVGSDAVQGAQCVGKRVWCTHGRTGNGGQKQQHADGQSQGEGCAWSAALLPYRCRSTRATAAAQANAHRQQSTPADRGAARARGTCKRGIAKGEQSQTHGRQGRACDASSGTIKLKTAVARK
eukprot:6205700-Pleurochrysis_carterae.AAC.2